jgi:hypothetical protein
LMEDATRLAVTAALDVRDGGIRFGPAWPQLAERLGLSAERDTPVNCETTPPAGLRRRRRSGSPA